MSKTLQRVPPRGLLVNLATNERMPFQFNPETLEESLSAKYARVEIPGLSHQRLQYVSTSNKLIPLELYLSQLAMDKRAKRASKGPKRPRITTVHKRFLESLLYPRQTDTEGILGPPQVLFIWPRTIAMVGKIMKLQFLNRQFSIRTGEPVVVVAKLSFEEDRETRLLMDDVRREGSERSGAEEPNEGQKVEKGGG